MQNCRNLVPRGRAHSIQQYWADKVGRAELILVLSYFLNWRTLRLRGVARRMEAGRRWKQDVDALKMLSLASQSRPPDSPEPGNIQK